MCILSFGKRGLFRKRCIPTPAGVEATRPGQCARLRWASARPPLAGCAPLTQMIPIRQTAERIATRDLRAMGPEVLRNIERRVSKTCTPVRSYFGSSIVPEPFRSFTIVEQDRA